MQFYNILACCFSTLWYPQQFGKLKNSKLIENCLMKIKLSKRFLAVVYK